MLRASAAAQADMMRQPRRDGINYCQQYTLLLLSIDMADSLRFQYITATVAMRALRRAYVGLMRPLPRWSPPSHFLDGKRQQPCPAKSPLFGDVASTAKMPLLTTAKHRRVFDIRRLREDGRRRPLTAAPRIAAALPKPPPCRRRHDDDIDDDAASRAAGHFRCGRFPRRASPQSSFDESFSQGRF